jgi:hypothetical protein
MVNVNRIATAFGFVCLLIASSVSAQELEPRAYWITPKASNALYIGYTYLDGEFREDPGTIIGASVRIQAPTGKYSSSRLINVGHNRWAFKPQIGLMQPIQRRFLIELALGTWLFTDNKEFLVDQTWSQDPLLSSEFHFVWRIRPAFWASFDVNYFYGGKATLEGVEVPTVQSNSRFGGIQLLCLLKAAIA